MKKRPLIPFIRVFLVFTIVFIATEYFYKTGSNLAFIDNPSVRLTLILTLIVLIIFEITASIKKTLKRKSKELEQLSPSEIQAKMVEVDEGFLKTMLKKLTKSKPVADEAGIMLDHNYDGIRELDNALPPWWLYSFYASIIFAILFLGYYHILGGKTSVQAFEEEVEMARLEVEKYKKENPSSSFDLNSLTVSTNTDKGKEIFGKTCAVCHAIDLGGGIGPNLVDEYWILGGGIKEIYNTISEGGREGKGMVSWKSSFSSEEIRELASYILSLNGTSPKKPKAKQGELWKGK